MQLEHKIELINSYMRVLNHALPTRTKNEKVREEIDTAFKAWVTDRIAELTGDQKSGPTTLTAEEVVFVRAFRTALQKKRAAKTTPKSPSAPAAQARAPQAKAPAPPAPPSSEEMQFADFLADLERDAPEF